MIRARALRAAATSALFIAGFTPAPLSAHPEHAGGHAPGHIPWSWDPWALVGIGLLVTVYTTGARRLRRQPAGRLSLPAWRIAMFATACAVLGIALLSPLDVVADVLFSAHMGQHILLMLVAAPLLVLSRPIAVYAWALPSFARRRLGGMMTSGAGPPWRWLTTPVVVWSLHACVLLGWHARPLFELALHHEWVHAIQHLSFLAAAALFWWSMAQGRHGRLGYGAAVIYVFTTALYSSLLGALLTFADVEWYPTHGDRTLGWGIAPIQDQQLAGLIMWVPAGVILAGLALGLFAAWLGESERRAAAAGAELRATSASGHARRAQDTWTAGLLLAIAAGLVGASACSTTPSPERRRNTEAARVAIGKYGCGSCHEIPGIPGAHGQVGPPLTGIASRMYLAGHVPNTPENMARWIQQPQQLEPGNIMPDMASRQPTPESSPTT